MIGLKKNHKLQHHVPFQFIQDLKYGKEQTQRQKKLRPTFTISATSIEGIIGNIPKEVSKEVKKNVTTKI